MSACSHEGSSCHVLDANIDDMTATDRANIFSDDDEDLVSNSSQLYNLSLRFGSFPTRAPWLHKLHLQWAVLRVQNIFVYKVTVLFFSLSSLMMNEVFI